MIWLQRLRLFFTPRGDRPRTSAGRVSRFAPMVLIAVGLVIAFIAGYHALDSWYLQTANASRLRAEYGAIAAARFAQFADEALRKEIASDPNEVRRPSDPQRYAPVFAKVFSERKLLPSGVPKGFSNEDMLTLQVLTPSGATIFEAGRPRAGEHISRETLGEDLGGLIIAVSARKSAVAWLATEHLASRMAIILWMIVLSSIVTVIAVRLMGRESRLVQTRTDFVSSVSHELRTPLAQIQIFLETLRLGRYRTEAQREWIFDGMQREITRLTTLVNNVLQFSRSERGGSHSLQNRRETELAPYLEEIVNGFAPLAAVRSTRIETQFTHGLSASLAPDSFRQVILNLLDNAVKYGPEDQTVRLVTERAGDRIRIILDDEGPGVPNEDRGRVWNAFQRGSNAVGTVAVGSGIGLSVVRDIVMAHGGSVTIADAPGGGGRFIVELPSASASNQSRVANEIDPMERVS